MSSLQAGESLAKYLFLCLLFVVTNFIDTVHSRGGGSKRTFGSPKTSNQQTVDCSGDQQQQQGCSNEQSDPSWSSVFGATMALIGPLLVLLTFIIMIKFCFYNSYSPKGQFGKQQLHEQQKNKKDQQQQQQQQPQKQQQQYFDSSSLKISLDDNNNNNNYYNNYRQFSKQIVAETKDETCCCSAINIEESDTQTKCYYPAYCCATKGELIYQLQEDDIGNMQ